MLSFAKSQRSSPTQYERLYPSSEKMRSRNHSSLRAKCLSTCLMVLILSLVSAASYMAGRRSRFQDPKSILNFTSHAHRFQYNRTFTEKPSTTTNTAWKELFPVQGGFFKHPVLAKNRSTFAVFHQLHCLDGLRHGYWALFDIASQAKGLEESELPFHASPQHVRHCIDLLRNVLVCQPDLTLEVKDNELGGVTGFGTEHQCVDWEGIVGWTTEWENYHQKAGSGKAPHSHHAGHHLHE